MPTLVDVQLPEAVSAVGEDVSDDISETILFDDEQTVSFQRSHAELDESTMLLSPTDRSTMEKARNHYASSAISNHSSTQRSSRNDNQKMDGEHAHNNTTQPPEPIGEVSQRTNQDLYEERYQDFVKGIIADFQRKHPGHLRDYRQMCLEEKEIAQQDILDLLRRLGVHSDVSAETTGDVLIGEVPQYHRRKIGDNQEHPGEIIKDPEETVLSISPQAAHERTVSFHRDIPHRMSGYSQPDDRNSSSVNADKSALLLSPTGFETTANKSAMLLSPRQPSHQSMEQSEMSFGQQPGDDSDQDSVEIVRGHKSTSPGNNTYDSPVHHHRPNPCKRLASSSGKRGADIARQRLSQESTPSLVDPRRGAGLEMDISSDMHRLSISPPRLFEASQSPITPRLTYDSSDDEKHEKPSHATSRIRHLSRRGSGVTIDTVESQWNRSHECGKDSKRRVMRDVPVNVKLAQGATFHLDKLHVKSTAVVQRAKRGKKTRQHRMVSFPDPFVHYNNRDKGLLRDIFGWIKESERHDREEEDDSPTGCIIFSVPIEKIIDLSLKLLLKDFTTRAQYTGQHSESPDLRGHTIVVVRTKDELSKWETALREGTGCSVLNHSSLSLSERVRASSAEKASRYDVVLTTFDSLKSPDVAIPLNQCGHAIENKATSNDGWYSKTSSGSTSPRLCKQLSVLHQIEFRRIIFTDTLGRKSYLAKQGTARAAAALALRGYSRLVYFYKSDETSLSGLAALRKSDRRAIQSVISLLRLESPDLNEQELLGEHTYDADEC
eukprot:scaffold1384_cov116-Cylindrotheca_fusiformis.AAC.17